MVRVPEHGENRPVGKPVAFAPDLAAVGRQSIGKTIYHGIGGFYQWTLNPYFDIRLAGEILVPGDGYKDIARLANCNFAPGGAFQSCGRRGSGVTGGSPLPGAFLVETARRLCTRRAGISRLLLLQRGRALRLRCKERR